MAKSKDEWSPKDSMKRDLFLLHAWESKVEGRRTSAVAERLGAVFYIQEERIYQIIRELGGQPYSPPPEVYSTQKSLHGKVWGVWQEVYAGGYCRQVVTCEGVYMSHADGGKTAALEEIKRLEKKVKLWQLLSAL